MVIKDPAVDWLLGFGDPSVRYLTLTEVLDEPLDSREARTARKQIPNGSIVKTLLAGERPDGGFSVHPYVPKWTGTHWRLVSLVELGIPPGYRPAGEQDPGRILESLDLRERRKLRRARR